MVQGVVVRVQSHGQRGGWGRGTGRIEVTGAI